MPSSHRSFDFIGAPTTPRADKPMSAAEFKRHAAATIAEGEKATAGLKPTARNARAPTAVHRRSPIEAAGAAAVSGWAAINARRFEPFMARALRAGVSAAAIRTLQALPTNSQIDAALRRLEAAQ